MHPSRPTGARSPRLLPSLKIDGDACRATSGRFSPSPYRTRSLSGTSQLRLSPSLSPTTVSPSVVSPSVTSPQNKSWSYYHRGCFSSHFGDCHKSSSCGKKSKLPRPISLASIRDAASFTDYVNANRGHLDSYVVENVSLSDIERWLRKKLDADYNAKKTSERKIIAKTGGSSSKKNDFTELISLFDDEPSEHSVLAAMTARVADTVCADAHRVYKLFPDHPNFVQYFVENSSGDPRLARAETEKVALVLEAAARADCWTVTRGEDSRFPNTPVELLELEGGAEASHILYVPILTSSGKVTYVLEMWRLQQPFSESDKQCCCQFLTWGSLVLHFCNLYLDKCRERNMSDFLLDVVKAIFEEMVSLDQLIKRILEFAQRLVNADRASLFLVDYRNFELVSTVFDLKFEPGQTRDVEKKEIRMPINRGIAGHVALSGETMNIPDAYSDYRFNREVDEATGYKTISILCMPIKVQGKVIGVVQMVNKRNDDSFHHEDEVAFEIFSTFFGLALHHARLYDRIMRKEQKYRVALEVLSYHNTCRENEVQDILRDPEFIDINLNDFYLDPYKFNEFEKCKAVIKMFNDLFNLSKFDIMTVTRFILTVKKNYRTVPYHNFDHGWSVAHSMYVVLKNDVRRRYNYKMRLALFVACLCHDLDHRGYTNKYMSETASPLASMYTTSTLEHHHFNITVTILQQDGHNIFSHMSSEEYKEVLGMIRHCILATDLAAFFPNLAKMKDLHDVSTSPGFNWANNSHRELAMAISMTAADLSASAKPWHIQIKTVKVIFEEFYDQGDKERSAGRVPIPMMDRNKPDEQPDSQVGFLSQICIPCYKVLYRILPTTKPMYVMALKNLHNWKSKANRIQLKLGNSTELSDSEIEDVSEEVLMQGEIEYVEEESEKETEDQATATGLEKITDQEEHIGEILREDEREVLRGIDDDASWVEEEKIESGEKIGGRLSKDIEGVTWMDEEGVVVRPNGVLKGYKGNCGRKTK